VKATEEPRPKLKFADSAHLRSHLLETNPRMMLSFSRGKDAIAAWVAMEETGFEVVPVHMDLVPGLEFVSESLRYYEKAFARRIYSVPHPRFVEAIDRAVLQPPTTVRALEDLVIWRGLTHRDVMDAVARSEGLEPGAYYATGVRASDNLTRRLAMKKYGPLTASTGKAHVVYDWGSQEVEDSMRRRGLRLPVDYELFGRTFDGLWGQYLVPIAERFPADFARICEAFPMADMLVWHERQALEAT